MSARLSTLEAELLQALTRHAGGHRRAELLLKVTYSLGIASMFFYAVTHVVRREISNTAPEDVEQGEEQNDFRRSVSAPALAGSPRASRSRLSSREVDDEVD